MKVFKNFAIFTTIICIYCVSCTNFDSGEMTDEFYLKELKSDKNFLGVISGIQEVNKLANDKILTVKFNINDGLTP